MMRYPDFFNAAPIINVHDPLAEFLGAMTDGLIEYRYVDAVILAGHSCPTVASTFLMLRAGLNALYPGEIPERGGIKVAFRGNAEEGVTGVMANIASLITGVTEATGFKGLGGRFDRRHRLDFHVAMDAELRLTRTDTGRAVELSAELVSIPMDPRLRHLLPQCLSGSSDKAMLREFQILWQDRVRRLLLEHKEDPEVIRVRLV